MVAPPKVFNLTILPSDVMPLSKEKKIIGPINMRRIARNESFRKMIPPSITRGVLPVVSKEYPRVSPSKPAKNTWNVKFLINLLRYLRKIFLCKRKDLNFSQRKPVVLNSYFSKVWPLLRPLQYSFAT